MKNMVFRLSSKIEVDFDLECSGEITIAPAEMDNEFKNYHKCMSSQLNVEYPFQLKAFEME